MHILVIGINYWPEQTSVAPFTTGVCEHLVEAGHQVTVVTAFPYYPEWRIRDGYRGRFYSRETIRGVDVRRVLHYVPKKPKSLMERLLHDMTFSLQALIAACGVRGIDAILCSSPPPFTPLVAWIHSRTRRVPYAVKITDLATEAAISTGILAPGLLARLARSLERFNYRGARSVSVLCRSFKAQLVELGVPADQVFVVPDWADTVRIQPLERQNRFRCEQGFDPSDFVVLHAGNMGLKQKLETVIEAAALTEKSGVPIKWLLVGDGEDREQLQQMARARSLSSVRFLRLLPRETLPWALASADLLILAQRASVTDAVIPSKLLTYMASGRAIVASVNAQSEAARRLNDARCGVIVTPEDPRALTDAVARLRELPGDLDEFGRRARAYVEANFSQAAVLGSYDRFFDTVLRVPAPLTRLTPAG